jgi:hypothetical protein
MFSFSERASEAISCGNMGFERVERPCRFAPAVAQALASGARRFTAQHRGVELTRCLIVEEGRSDIGSHLGRPGGVRRMASWK